MRPVVRALGIVPFCLLAAGCPDASSQAPGNASGRTCGLDVWVKPASREARVELVGSWNGFSRPGITLSGERADGWRMAHVDVPAGEHRYAFVEDGVFRADPLVSTTAWEGDREVSWVHTSDCAAPLLRVDGVERDVDGSSIVRATFMSAAAGEGREIDPQSIALSTRTGEVVAPRGVDVDAAKGTLRIALAPLERGKHVLSIGARDRKGRAAAPVRASVWSGVPAPDNADAVVYQIIVDRFANESGALASPAEPAGRAGGTLRGVTRAVERGDFAVLGVNTIWLSPVYKNPQGFFSGGIGRKFSSYHGYWPVDTRGVEPALGSEADLDALVSAAHARGIRIILDVVPNHVHAQHPYWAERATDVGFNAPDGKCLCGVGDCPWSTSIERCWFAPYLPDLDTRNEDTLRRTVEDVVYWLDRFELDGLRIDAVPMMPRSTTRRIAALARERFQHAGHPLYLVGETFTSEGGFDSIRYNLGPMGLDGQFHFPLMWALRKAIAHESQPLSSIDEALRAGEESFRGSGAVMATIIGNHDVTRFASESDGTASGDGFDPAPWSTSDTVFAKQKLALGILFALPGAPVLYYGDEVAVPGRSDPDSRRVMPSDDSLPAAARAVREFVSRVGKLRACSEPLRRGRYVPLASDAETWAFARGSAVVVVARRPIKGASALDLHVPRDAAPPGRYVDALDRASTTVIGEDGLTSVTVPPFSLRIFLPEGDPCASP